MSFKQWFKDHSDELPGDWGHQDILWKVAGHSVLFWCVGLVLALVFSWIICFLIKLVFDYDSSGLLLLFFAPIMVVVLILSVNRMKKQMDAISEKKEEYSKEERTVIERRLTQVTLFVIFEVAAALFFFGLFVYEIVSLFR